MRARNGANTYVIIQHCDVLLGHASFVGAADLTARRIQHAAVIDTRAITGALLTSGIGAAPYSRAVCTLGTDGVVVTRCDWRTPPHCITTGDKHWVKRRRGGTSGS